MSTAPAPRRGDAGNAVVEFLGISLILLIPLVYLVLTLAKVQGASYAVEGAARVPLAGPDQHVAPPDLVRAGLRAR